MYSWRAACWPWGHRHGRRGYRVDVLHAVQQHVREFQRHPGRGGAFIAGFSSIMTALNFIVTIQKMRAPGLTWFRLPLFIWAMYATSLVVILGTPVVAITLVMIFAERFLGFGIFDPTLGGDPVLFQHLFWFYSHPAVYIMILPGMGVISELISCFSRRRVYGYTFVAFSSLAIAVIGFFVWGHHMFVSSQSVYAGLIFSFLTFFVAIPTAIKILNWIMTMFKGSYPLRRPCCMPSVSWVSLPSAG
jgi:cytochrome c oxidase subunit 1